MSTYDLIKKMKEELSTRPTMGEPIKGRLKKMRRVKIGKYRIFYVFAPCKVEIPLLGHRETVYERY